VRTLIQLVLWNIGFVAAFALLVVNAGRDAGGVRSQETQDSRRNR
jgi:hypothetical protein